MIGSVASLAMTRARAGELGSSAALRGALLAIPMAGFWLLLAAPSLDGHWEQHPAHLHETVAGKHAVSVLFADLCGFTSFSEHRDPREVSAMLTSYFEAPPPPVVRQFGGEIDR